MTVPNLSERLNKALEPLRTWPVQRRMGVGLVAVAGLAALVLASKLLGGGANGPQIAGGSDIVPELSHSPSYANTYPMQIFNTKPVQRAVQPASTATNLTFRGIESADLRNPPKYSDISATTQAVIKDRQYLAQHGYSWSPEGFLSSARKGDLEALQTYLRAGMSPGTRNAFSSTALHAAAESNNMEAAKILLRAGANPNVATTNLQTPLHRAVSQNLPAMTKLLLAAGANPKATTLEGWTPLFYAVDNNNQALMEVLLAAGSNVNATDRFGNTALTIAVRKNYIGIVQRLIYLGAKVNVADLAFRTPLHYAVGGGYYQLTKLLLENGAKADVRDKNGLLPMDIALANQDLALANLLLANGSKRPQLLGTKAVGIKPPTKPEPLTPGQTKGEPPISHPKNYSIGPAQPSRGQ